MANDAQYQSVVLYITAEGKVRFHVHDNLAAQIDIVGNTIIEDDKLHLLTVTGDRDGLLRLYIDAVEDAEPLDMSALAGRSLIFDNNSTLMAGPSVVGPPVATYGDQPVFLKTALTPQQIADILWNDGYGRNIDEAEIVDVSPSGAWYSEFDAITLCAFKGRFFRESAWHDEGGTLKGGIEVIGGGVPLRSIVTATAGEGGSITPSGEVKVVDGEDESFTATPAAGYAVNQWLINGKVIHTGGLTHTLRDISDNMTVAVTFSVITRQLCTLADIKDRLGIGVDNTEYDSMLNRIILGLEDVFNGETGRKLLMTNADVTEYHTGSGRYLQLERYPVISITSVRESALYTFGDESALTADTDYRLVRDGKNGIIHRIGFKWSEFDDAIQVIYRGGYCGADEMPGEGEHALPADLREAAILQASFIYKRRNDIGLSSVSAEGGSISKFSAMDLLPLVKETLNRYRRPQL